MTDRAAALRKLVVGDIFHGESENGASLICLTMSVTDTTIHAGTVTSQSHLVFDRHNGTARWGEEQALCKIDSTAPLPVEIHRVLVELDERYSLGTDPHRFRLLDAEKRALVFVASYYPSRPL